MNENFLSPTNMIKCMCMGHLGSKVGFRQRSFIICTRHRKLPGRAAQIKESETCYRCGMKGRHEICS